MENTQVLETIEKKFNEVQKSASDTFVKKEELKALSAQIESLKSNTELSDKINKLETAIADSVKKLDAFKSENQNTEAEKRKALIAEIKEVAEKINNGYTGRIALKAAVDMTFGNTITSGNVPQATRLAGISELPKYQFRVADFGNNITIANRLVDWVEQIAVEGAGAMTSEGTAKSKVSTTYKTVQLALSKATAYGKVSTEMLSDALFLVQHIENQLRYEVLNVKNNQVLTGDGTAPNVSGISTLVGGLDLAALADTFALNGSNRWDAIGAAVTQINVNMKGAAQANAIFMNPADIYLMVHASRSTANEYIYPVTVTPEGTFYSNIPIIPDSTMTAGTFLVGDFNKLLIFNHADGLKVEMGRDADDFTKNMVTIIAELRYTSYIPANDREAFVYDTFANAKLHIEKAA